MLDKIIQNNGLLEYDACDVFNLDETALFWRTIAKRGLVIGTEAPKVAPLKDRVTLVVAASLTGEKLPLCLIGTANQPNGFRLPAQQTLKDNYSLFYAFEKDTAWMTRNTFYENLKYSSRYFKSHNHHIDLLCDAPSVHLLGTLDKNSQLIIQTFEFIKLIYLPSDCTCVLQPADQGLIRSFKARYRYHLLTRLCAESQSFIEDSNSNLQTFNIKHKIKFNDCVSMCILAWSDIDTSVIVNAWVKSTIAAYWNIPKMKSSLYLHQRALKDCLKRSKSIFADLDVFNEFTAYEDMGLWIIS